MNGQPPASSRSAPSLRRRLLWLVLAAIALASLLQASTAYHTALKQADAMFDEHLQEIARSIHGGLPVSPAPGLGDAAYDFQVQIWGPDGAQLFRSPRTALPPLAVLGFSDGMAGGVRYRVYSLQTPEQTVQIAQDLDARQARARSLALRAVFPVALLAPLLMLAVWWLIDRSLAPVERTRRQVAARTADDLSPLPDDGLPQEVLPLVQELNLLFGRSRLAFEAQRNFVADAAHELRSPLTALKLQLQLLQRAPDEASRATAIDALGEGITRAARLVEQLLTLARSEPGAPVPAPSPIDLSELVRQAVALTLPLANTRGSTLALFADAPVPVHGDAAALTALVRNLADNAVRYSPPNAQVELRVSMEAGAPTLQVDDSGPGIPPEDHERVFDRFYRRAHGDEPGSGLGLAIVRSVAEQHGAHVALATSKLGGLQVTVRFAPAS